MPPLSIRTAQPLPATQTIRSSQKHFVFHSSSIANKYSQNDTVGGRTTSLSWKCPPLLSKIQFNQCHHQHHTSTDQYNSKGAPTYPFLQIVTVCISVPPVPYWSCLYQKKRYKFCGFTKTVWFEYENILPNYQAKKATYTIQNES